MAEPIIRLPIEFQEFLKSLNSSGVDYLIVGGYAVNHHGYVRPTGDIDIWIAVNPKNADRMVAALRDFGFDSPPPDARMFLKPNHIVRMGHPPLRIELFTDIVGLTYDECSSRSEGSVLDGIPVRFLSLRDLRQTKAACGRPKDRADLHELPQD